MTRTTVRMRISAAAALAATGLIVTSVRLVSPARADGPQKREAPDQPAAPEPLKTDLRSIDGIVVDEAGQPVAGAVVSAMAQMDALDKVATAADGRFTLPRPGQFRLLWEILVAETEGGTRMGVGRFDEPLNSRPPVPVRIVLKRSRPVTVQVKDATGEPVPEADVHAIGDRSAFVTRAATGPAGAATLNIPADVSDILWVTGQKAGAGFDYFENYRTWPAAAVTPLPDVVSLTLDGCAGRPRDHSRRGEPPLARRRDCTSIVRPAGTQPGDDRAGDDRQDVSAAGHPVRHRALVVVCHGVRPAPACRLADRRHRRVRAGADHHFQAHRGAVDGPGLCGHGGRVSGRGLASC